MKFQLYATIPDHTKTQEEILAGAVREEFVGEFEAFFDLSWYVRQNADFDALYGDYTELRIVKRED